MILATTVFREAAIAFATNWDRVRGRTMTADELRFFDQILAPIAAYSRHALALEFPHPLPPDDDNTPISQTQPNTSATHGFPL